MSEKCNKCEKEITDDGWLNEWDRLFRFTHSEIVKENNGEDEIGDVDDEEQAYEELGLDFDPIGHYKCKECAIKDGNINGYATVMDEEKELEAQQIEEEMAKLLKSN